MKKLIAVVVSIFVLASCEGTTGPQGPPGEDGVNIVGQGFEVNADFTADNGYSQLFSFADYGAEALDTDVVLVYWLYGVDENTGDDIWQQLPASVFFQDGAEMQYGFDHTFEDVQLYLTGDVDLSTVGTGYTQDQIFRVAILPVDYVQSNNLDTSNMNEVMGAMGNKGFKKVNIIQK